MSWFTVEKYYFDIVTPDDEVWIGYSAHIKLCGITLSYAQSLVKDSKSTSIETSFKRHKHPHMKERFRSHTPLFLLSSKDILSPSCPQRLLTKGKGSVDWQVIAPSSALQVNLPHRQLSGQGYLEKLTLTLGPWHLPITTLYWGRFIGQKHHAVWIRWHHAEEKMWLFFDNKEVNPTTISLEKIVFDQAHITITNQRLIIDSEPFKQHTRLLGILMPKGFRSLHERKWLADGELIFGNEIDRGAIIHECVTFINK